MSYKKHSRTEHAGPKNSGRKSGWWGLREEAKDNSRKIRRQIDREMAREQKEMERNER